jgi:hypothetical protein
MLCYMGFYLTSIKLYTIRKNTNHVLLFNEQRLTLKYNTKSKTLPFIFIYSSVFSHARHKI